MIECLPTLRTGLFSHHSFEAGSWLSRMAMNEMFEKWKVMARMGRVNAVMNRVVENFLSPS